MKVRFIPVAIGATLLLAGCPGDDVVPDVTAEATAGGVLPDLTPEATADDGMDDPDEGVDGAETKSEEQTGPPAVRSAFVRVPLRGRSDSFSEGDLGDNASLEFTGEAYRMVSSGGPLISPLLDEQMALMTDVQARVTVAAVTSPGLVGVTCGIDETGAYLFVAGLNEFDEPFYAIGRLDMPQGGVRSLRDAHLDDTPAAADVVDPAAGFTIAGRCEPGDDPDEALLYLEIDDEDIASVRATFGSPAGQVGLFAIGQGPEPLTVDVKDFQASGTRD